MGAITYRDGIAILQLVVFPFVVAAAFLIWKRTGWRIGSKIWRFAVTLGLIRIAGSICSLLTISHDSYNVEVAVAVCELIGIAPLLLTYVGILRQIDMNQRMNPRLVKLLTLAGFIALVLGIAGVSTADDSDTTYHADGMVKVSMAIFLVIFAIVVLACSWLYADLHYNLRVFQKRLFLASFLSYPFLLVRLIYSAIGDYTTNRDFSVIDGNATIYLCMSVLEEIIAIGLTMVLGLSAVTQRDFVKLAQEPPPEQIEYRHDMDLAS